MYPEFFHPNSSEIVNLDNRAIEIPTCHVSYKQWAGVPVKETFGGKPIIDFENNPMFPELAIAKQFIKSDWQSRWIETYGKPNMKPIFLSEWHDDKYITQINSPIQDESITGILHGIAIANNNSFAGCWDVIGWRQNRILFAEAKWSKKDRIRTTQLNWLSASLKCGLQPDNFLFIYWHFA